MCLCHFANNPIHQDPQRTQRQVPVYLPALMFRVWLIPQGEVGQKDPIVHVGRCERILQQSDDTTCPFLMHEQGTTANLDRASLYAIAIHRPFTLTVFVTALVELASWNERQKAEQVKKRRKSENEYPFLVPKTINKLSFPPRWHLYFLAFEELCRYIPKC